VTLRVLITGAGSGVGQAVAKALNISTLKTEIIFADISPYNPGLYRSDESVIIPLLQEDGGLDEFINIVNHNNIDVIVPGTVFDLPIFSEHKDKIENLTKAKVIVSPLEVVQIGVDKWLTAEFLRENNLPSPSTFLLQSIEEAKAACEVLGFPLILKPRFGAASRGLYVIKDFQELLAVFESVEEPVLQEQISPPSSSLSTEYTCSITKLANGKLIGPFTARRALRGGQSWVVEVGHFKELHPLLIKIGEKLPIWGSMNVQLMVGENGPIPFEFNPRFSGTTAMRAHFGFNEPEMILKSLFFDEDISTPEYRNGYAFRYMEEVFVDGDDLQSFPDGVRNDWF